MNKQNRKRVVILGGGFDGVLHRSASGTSCCASANDFEILLINKENYFVFQPDRIYIIARGQAEVARGENSHELVLARPGPGEYFGEMALMNKTTRNSTVRVRGTT